MIEADIKIDEIQDIQDNVNNDPIEELVEEGEIENAD